MTQHQHEQEAAEFFLAVQIAHLRKNNVLAAPRLCRNRQHLGMGGVKPVPLRPAPPAGGQNVALHRFAGLYQLCHNAGNGGKAEAGCTGKGANAGAVRRVAGSLAAQDLATALQFLL